MVTHKQLTVYETRCDAKPNDLDNPDANLRTREQTTALLDSEDPESLWYDYGIIPDLLVCCHGTSKFNVFLSEFSSHL